jgi:voltage-gated potassium channel
MSLPAASADRRRRRRLQRLQARLEVPMIVLAFVWLALFVVEAIWGAPPWLQGLNWLIWGVFLVEFAVGLLLAPRKGVYLRHNWLKALALAAPALRMLRVFRVLRLARAAGLVRGTRMVRIVSSLNRGMGALGKSVGRRGAGYVSALTLLVAFAGAAGMYAFENDAGARGFRDFGDALWWTAMMMTTMGSAYWPETVAGRVLCVLLALYAFAVFGYVTALLASFFVGRDAGRAAPAGDSELARLRDEVGALRAAIERLSAGERGQSR